MKQKEGERGQDSGETERECVCERVSVAVGGKDSVSNKIDR
jgi:hypothetical protein